MSKKAKRTRRQRYYQLKDGSIVESGSLGELLIASDGSNVKRAFLANMGPVTGRRDALLVRTSDGKVWQFNDMEDLQFSDGKFVTASQASAARRTVTDGSQTRVVGNSDAFFSMEMPDLQGLIAQLDMFDQDVNGALRQVLHQIGDNIVRAQRKHIEGTRVGKRVSPHISRSRVYTTQKGLLGITAGYQPGAFKKDAEGFNAGVVGMTYEFGRPGTSPQRSGKTMKQMRNGKQVEVNKGTIQPVPHIRLGYDETLEQNIQTLVNAVNAEIERLNRGE